MKKSIFSASKLPNSNRCWGWNNLTKVVQSTNKVWHLHSPVLKKSTFFDKKLIWLELLLFFPLQNYDCFCQLSRLWSTRIDHMCTPHWIRCWKLGGVIWGLLPPNDLVIALILTTCVPLYWKNVRVWVLTKNSSRKNFSVHCKIRKKKEGKLQFSGMSS